MLVGRVKAHTYHGSQLCQVNPEFVRWSYTQAGSKGKSLGLRHRGLHGDHGGDEPRCGGLIIPSGA